MKSIDVVRAWKDEAYRMSLSAEERALVPENPAGPIELRDEDLAGAGGLTEVTQASTSWCLCPTRSMCTSCDFSCS